MAEFQTPADHCRKMIRLACAEMLAVPQMLCPARDCRRKAQCIYLDRETMMPGCLSAMTPAQRAVYDRLLAFAERFHAAVVPGALESWHGRFGKGDELELQMAALEVLRAVLRPGDWRIAALRAFWRREAAGDVSRQ